MMIDMGTYARSKGSSYWILLRRDDRRSSELSTHTDTSLTGIYERTTPLSRSASNYLLSYLCRTSIDTESLLAVEMSDTPL